jgi:hypothetical protein
MDLWATLVADDQQKCSSVPGRVSVGGVVGGWHRRLAPVGSAMCLALATRRVRRSWLEAWERELRDLADAIRVHLTSMDVPSRE